MKRYASALILGTAALLALSACAGGDSSTSGEAMPVQDSVMTEPGREIIRNADMSVRVDDVRSSTAEATRITRDAGGRISQESVTATGEALYATITARIPADRLDTVIAEMGGLGEVTSLNVFTDDVTAQGADLDARIEALQTSITRLRDLLAQANTTKDLIDIEGELTARQAELDSLVAQRSVLSEAVAMSTLNVYLSPSSEAAEWTPPGFLSGLQSGWNALRTLTAGLITLVGFLLPFIAVLGVLAVPIVILIIWLRRRR